MASPQKHPEAVADGTEVQIDPAVFRAEMSTAVQVAEEPAFVNRTAVCQNSRYRILRPRRNQSSMQGDAVEHDHVDAAGQQQARDRVERIELGSPGRHFG